MEIEYVIIDDKKFGITKEISHDNYVYVYLASLNNPEEQLIKKYLKSNPDELLPLENEEEFNFALKLYIY